MVGLTKETWVKYIEGRTMGVKVGNNKHKEGAQKRKEKNTKTKKV